jgi:hypothetical protein
MSYPPSADPWFYDETDFIECNECGNFFDHNDYDSFTCCECEDKLMGAKDATTIPNSL